MFKGIFFHHMVFPCCLSENIFIFFLNQVHTLFSFINIDEKQRAANNGVQEKQEILENYFQGNP